MSRSNALAFAPALLFALVGAGVWLVPGPTVDRSTAPAVTAEPGPTPTTRRLSSPETAAAHAPTSTAEVADALAHWRDLHAPQGKLTLAETRLLIAERDAAAEALAESIGRLPADALPGVLRSWREADATRDRLVIIDGLGRSAHAEAVDLLTDIYEEGDGFTNRSHVLRALGDSPAEGHTLLLTDQMWAADDDRLGQLSAQALYGEPAAASELVEAVTADLPINTRLEAIHSLGATGTDGARDALLAFAEDASLEQRVQQYAQKELERSFGG